MAPAPAAKEKEEAFSVFLRDLCAGLADEAGNNYMLPYGCQVEMEKLSHIIQENSPLIKDAKARDLRIKGNPQSSWLREVESIIDEVDAVMQSNKMPAVERDFWWLRPSGGDGQKLYHELTAMSARLEKLLKKKVDIHNNLPSTDLIAIRKMAVRNCPVEVVPVAGKDEEADKDMIVGLLLSAVEIVTSERGGPFVIAIDRTERKGGGGTSELAKSIYDDKRITDQLGRRVWYSASGILEPSKLPDLLAKPASTLFWVHETAKKVPMLMVIDDIRNKKAYKMINTSAVVNIDEHKMKNKYSKGQGIDAEHKMKKKYSKGQGKNVKVVDPGSNRLSWEKAWKLFTERAFKNGGVDENRRRKLEGIGRDIVGELDGRVPAITGVADIMSMDMKPSYWRLIQESSLWKLPVEEAVAMPKMARMCYGYYR